MKSALNYIVTTFFIFAIGCSTIQPNLTTPSQKVTNVSAQIKQDVPPILAPVLRNNPKYIVYAKWIGANLPGLLQNGPINVTSVTAAIAATPGITVTEATDLAYISIGLNGALGIYSAATGDTVILYTNPNVASLVNAFCAAILDTANALQPAS